MKSKILIVGLIGLLMAGGLIMIGCDDDECTYGCELHTTSAGRGSSSCSRGECAVVKALNSGGTSATCSCN